MKNINKTKLKVCSLQPRTGWDRTGFCKHKKRDGGKHIVCATMTDDFLEYTRRRGNDLVTPSKGFPGLKAGDNWCICADRYTEAAASGHAPPIVPEATHKHALKWPALAKIARLKKA